MPIPGEAGTSFPEAHVKLTCVRRTGFSHRVGAPMAPRLRPIALPRPDGLSPLSPSLTGCGGISAKAARCCASSGRGSISTDAISRLLYLVAVDLKMGGNGYPALFGFSSRLSPEV